MGGPIIQLLVGLFLSVIIAFHSFSNSWPSYAFKLLKSDDSPFGYKITQSDGNLIASVTMLGSFTSIPIGRYIVDKFGRKRSVVLCGLLMTLSWSIIATGKTVTQVVIGRYLGGIAGGCQVTVLFVFMPEMCQPSMTGVAVSASSFMFNVGILVSYLMGWLCSYDVINYVNVTVLAAFVIFASLFLKETPLYLLKNGKEKEALNSLKFYRGATTATQEILDELCYIRKQLQTSDIIELNNESVESEKEKLKQEKCEPKIEENSSWKILMKSKSSQRIIILLTLHVALLVFMGMIGVQVYAGQFFMRAVPYFSPDLCSVILAVMMTVCSAATMYVTDAFSRRALMISTCTASGICMALLASMVRWSWAPDLCIPIVIVLFSTFYNLGPINLVYVQSAEAIPPQVKSACGPILNAGLFLANFVVIYVFEPLVNILGLDGIFFLFSVMSVVTVIFTYFFMRETRNVPYEVIQEMYEDGYLYKRSNKIVPY